MVTSASTGPDREDIFTHARARQAIGQGVEHRIVYPVSGKVIAGVERNV